ncbi:AzlC family ABC transporter permease [uncultured Eubacterium sp.]|uniref:AzlC family ABC transporter permease n=1 Tax=uncultured Eubacterium sp. TaxID=165185 RepID=UPI00280564A0|nr:AzlC family ABC transporter permease [uncultured Eubacterium sp.]
MKNKTKTIKFAFKMSLPVLFGYLFLGSAFGISLYEIGYNWIWAIVISLLVYAGSGQLLLVSMIASHASLASIAVMTFFVNSRHIFYGLSFIEKFRSYGWRYPSLIFSLTDETYGVNTSFDTAPKDVDEGDARFLIGIFDHMYWIVGSIIGNLAGQLIKIDFTGIDFSMTALFVVIFLDQILASKSKLPGFLGIICALVCLFIFGPDKFLLPSLIITVALLLGMKPLLDNKKEVM